MAGEHWSAVTNYLQIISAAKPQNVVAQIHSGTLTNVDQLRTLLSWQGWKIVEGPGQANRVGDPREAYDGWSVTKGVSGNQRATFQSVNLPYTVMRRLTAQPKRPGFAGKVVPNIPAGDAASPERLFTSETGNLRGKSPILWTEQMWTAEREGKVNRKRPVVCPPAWRKAF
ncbi:hypothetical protein ACMGDM_15465 [Sphingomonas sp. DT-51]|uniref:hypothetical protein n=1 Tax=Sphingomonas sp. DT-51 TaxID=3396165 RepID=UPI003F1B4129